MFKKKNKTNIDAKSVKDKIKDYLNVEIGRCERRIKNYEEFSKRADLELENELKSAMGCMEYYHENRVSHNNKKVLLETYLKTLENGSNEELNDFVSKEIIQWANCIISNEESIERLKINYEKEKVEIMKDYDRHKTQRKKMMGYDIKDLKEYQEFLRLVDGVEGAHQLPRKSRHL